MPYQDFPANNWITWKEMQGRVSDPPFGISDMLGNELSVQQDRGVHRTTHSGGLAKSLHKVVLESFGGAAAVILSMISQRPQFYGWVRPVELKLAPRRQEDDFLHATPPGVR
ncbi:hypothetical protein CIHG_09426 [Coccidioides immitis H538.4]|uniref:Uncharacterized protein n=3 Tax=Coccidioides immitis TaxID=5501 RepID=A0A0J8QMZ8_COCIT|nr:hypothetical protein CIRG_05220 [Coccidioides immitis RMSCC 2394]KMU73799.1 hypothetical protein CISG_10174 [Coccidioides immitis RMSCC 3703]KMU91667.1 hypothetical protein CIHG_09426 [Coccidioides immitis H538.4]TPX21848.1 hypothetical protein DIZ76_015813 [Coccidioides immitis]